MDALRKVGKALYKAYVGVGIAAMGFIAFAVIFAVVMRYFFGITFTFLEELITLVLAFSSFWGIGVCALENEHVIIDYFYLKIPVKFRRYVDIFNYVVVAATLVIIDKYAFKWIKVAGKALSNGLRIPYKFIYGAMPLGITVSLICVVYKIICLIMNKPVFADRKKEDTAA